MKFNMFSYFKNLYILFMFLSLSIFFFSTTIVKAKAFNVENIEISRPFEINFDKNEIIDEGFKKAFNELILLIVKTIDQEKIKKIQLNEIKGMIESFSIKEEKFIDEIYYVNLGVSFNKKKVYSYLESVNIFPSIPKKKKILFMPVIIDENKKELLIFAENKFFENWNKNEIRHHLLEYILPTEDLEEINLIKSKFETIEKYDFKEIIDKYYLEDSIIALIFKNNEELRILSRIKINKDIKLKNQSFINFDLNNDSQLKNTINDLKESYENFWKNTNQINTSIKLVLSVKINAQNNIKISNFEKTLEDIDLVYDFYISKFDKDFVFYQIIFNGTPNLFIKSMNESDYSFNTQNKIWILK